MRKTSAEKIADHFGSDIETIRDHEYQPGSYSVAVYMIDDELYAATKAKPVPLRLADSDYYWKQITSTRDPEVKLWKGVTIGAGIAIHSLSELSAMIRGKEIYIALAVYEDDKLGGTASLEVTAKQVMNFYSKSGLKPVLTFIDQESIYLSTTEEQEEMKP